jgi:hypothetical protein
MAVSEGESGEGVERSCEMWVLAGDLVTLDMFERSLGGSVSYVQREILSLCRQFFAKPE